MHLEVGESWTQSFGTPCVRLEVGESWTQSFGTPCVHLEESWTQRIRSKLELSKLWFYLVYTEYVWFEEQSSEGCLAILRYTAG